MNFSSISTCGEADQQAEIVGLNLCLVCRAVAAKLTAFGALMHDDKAFSGVGLYAHGAHLSTAFRSAVARIDIQMQRPQTKRTVIAGAVAEGQYLSPAVGTDEGGVIFGKAFLFHNKSLLKTKIEKRIVRCIGKICGAQKKHGGRA